MTEVEHVRNLLKTFPTAMLITHSGGKDLRARPMAIAEVEDDCRLWFLASAESTTAHEIETDTHVHVVCQNDRSAYLSLSGLATFSKDRARIEALWQESFRLWFPEGKEDPNIVLISVRPDKAEYWDSDGFNRIRDLLEAARAYAAGEKPGIRDRGPHGRVQF